VVKASAQKSSEGHEMGARVSTHLGSSETARANREKAEAAHALLDELIGRGITSGSRGALAVRITFQEGRLAKPREVWEVDRH
jgi:hypothetical protein